MKSDRTWPLPRAPWVMRMCWEDLLFAHWVVDANTLRKRIPAPLTLDTFDEKAYIGVVPFRMSDVAPRGIPAMGKLSRFPELNVRTYVTRDGKPGVFFFSLDATNPIAVRMARAFFCLPYMDADIDIDDEEAGHRYRCVRTHRDEPPATFIGQYSPAGPEFAAQPGTLEYWLTARYCLYSANRRGRVFRGEIDHPPWPLQKASAKLETNTLCDWLDIQLRGEPHLLYAKRIDVRAWLIQRT